jgi:5-methylcytosine-specific restriction enzyme A
MPRLRVGRDGGLEPDDRPTRMHSRRGSTRQWRKIRAAVIAASPVCAICGATEDLSVDHIEPLSLGGAMWDPSNLRVLCRSCDGRGGGRMTGSEYRGDGRLR